jgi:subtilase family serine protease
VSYYSALFIDGKQVAEDQITTILAPGQQLDRFFNYQFQMTPPQHTIRVCADWRQNITESNEQNNCWEEVWVIEEQKLPDLVVSKIECGKDSQLSVTLQNIGSGAIPSGWKALAEAYFGGVRKGAFDMTYTTATLNGGIDKPGGISVYLLNWYITEPVTVRVVADFTDDIEESNEQNNAREERVEPLVTKLPDLIVTKIECDTNNKLSVTISNIGDGKLSAGWSGVSDIYFDNILKSSFDLGKPTSVVGGGIETPGGSAIYRLAWDITAPVAVRVIIDAIGKIAESDEQNNTKEAKIEPQVSKLPDLVVSEIKEDQQNQLIGYVIKNIGQELAKAGHMTELSIDGKEVAQNKVGIDLAPGVTYESWFQDYKMPEQKTINVRVCADILNQVAEANEQNNYLDKVIKREIKMAPLIITSGPIIAQISETSAVISWETSEASDSLVRYDSCAGKYGYSKQDSNSTKSHSIKVGGLVSGTVYHFAVESKTTDGRQASSRDQSFGTSSPKDGEEPTISLRLPPALSGKVTISADANDNVNVDAVVFYLDSKAVYTAFSPPFEWHVDTTKYGRGSHQFSAEAIDAAGNRGQVAASGFIDNPIPDPNAPRVTILNPRLGDRVTSTVPIEADIQDDEGLREVKLFIDGVYTSGWTYTKTKIDGFINRPPKSKTLTYDWDIGSPTADSEHTIEVKAYDGVNWGHDGIRVTVGPIQVTQPPVTGIAPPLPPSLRLTRSVARFDNYFEITLGLENTGSTVIYSVVIEDKNRGFQCLRGVNPCEVTYSLSGQWSTVEIGYFSELFPGAEASLKYYAVPILFDPYDYSDYVVGYGCTTARCNANGRNYNFDFYLPVNSGPELDVEAALHSADYLIVTNPYNLFATNSSYDDVNNLLCSMADLAKEKLGALGYIYAPLSMSTALDGNDAMTLGDINHDGRDEVLIGRVGSDEGEEGEEEGWVNIYNQSGYSDEIKTNLNRSTGLAVGDCLDDGEQDIVTVISKWLEVWSLDGTQLGGIPHYTSYNDFDDDSRLLVADLGGDAKDEIIVATPEAVSVYLYTHGTIEHLYREDQIDFADGDSVAVGDVCNTSQKEVIIGNSQDGNLHCYEMQISDDWPDMHEVASIAAGYESDDGLAVGDINNDGREEIVVGHRHSHRVDVYRLDDGLRGILLFSIDTSFDGGDVLVLGDVCGLPGNEEIIIAEDGGGTEGMVYIYGYHGAYIPHLATSFGTSFDGDDYFLVGNVTGSEFEEIVIGNRGGHEKGSVELISVREGAPRDRERFQELTQEDGDWNIRLCSDWSSEGFLMLVGETEIIPAFTAGWADKDIHCTDYQYASTCGENKFPELAIGRIIGNTAADLIKPIESSLAVWRGMAWFDRNGSPRADAYGVSGNGRGEGDFWSGLCDIFGWIDNEFSVVKYRGKNLNNILDNFVTQIVGRDVIVYRDHGNDSSWAWGGDPSLGVGELLGYLTSENGTMVFHDPVVDFGTVKPFAFALACDAGKYIGIQGIAEAFLLKGAAVYIGSTEISYSQDNNEGGDKFFEKWIGHHGNPDKTLGQAWKETRHWCSDEWWGEGSTFWAAEYQFYGDPKFGAVR